MMTMSKLAKLAHVSVSTVSKAFSMSTEVNAQTREMIFDIARKNGCFKKFYTAKYPRYVITVICPEFQSRYYSSMISLVQKKLSNYNCEICVAATDFSNESKKTLLEYYDKYTDVDAIIMVDGIIDIDNNIEVPTVMIGHDDHNNSVVSIDIDHMPAVTEAIEYFKSKNITKIGYVGENFTADKKNKFTAAMEEIMGGYDENLISVVDERFEKGGYIAMQKLIDSRNIPRAIICGYDNMAIGAIRCIYENGLSVPNDIAVIGFNDIPEAKYLNPPLSSIDPHMDTICNIAVSSILDRLSGKEVEMKHKIIPTFNLRKSAEIL